MAASRRQETREVSHDIAIVVVATPKSSPDAT
jgi:hypothetical protein